MCTSVLPSTVERKRAMAETRVEDDVDSPTRNGRKREMHTSDRSAEGERGQTTIDFTIGVGFFLLAVAFAAVFTYSMMGPFLATSEDRTVQANQAADHLTEFGFHAAGERTTTTAPTDVDGDCVEGFFEDDADAIEECNFDHTANEIGREVDAPPGTTIHLRIETLDGDEIVYQTEEPRPSQATTSRIVVLEDEPHRLVAEVR